MQWAELESYWSLQHWRKKVAHSRLKDSIAAQRRDCCLRQGICTGVERVRENESVFYNTMECNMDTHSVSHGYIIFPRLEERGSQGG
jgi:hypothetical protein